MLVGTNWIVTIETKQQLDHVLCCVLAGTLRANKMAESSELLATYAGLGTHDGGDYFRGDECLGRYNLTVKILAKLILGNLC